MSEWISVNERFPEHDGVKGCSLGNSIVVDIYADGERWFNCYYSFDDECWYDTDMNCSIDLVTNWMYQPKPPAK